MIELIEFETPRLRLRQWRDGDRAPFAAINADPRVMAYFPAPLSRAASDALAARCRASIEARGWGLWAAERKADAMFVGFVGLNIPTATLPFSPCVEIDWRLGFEYWGLGLATEAAKASLQIGFRSLDLTEIVSFTALGNLRSRAVMARLGMIESAAFDHPMVAPNSPLRRHCLYRLAREPTRA